MNRFLKLSPRSLLILLAGVILTAGLVKAVVGHIQQVGSGEEITLIANGYDPRSLLSGHYAVLRYGVSNTNLRDNGVALPFTGSVPVWVQFEPATPPQVDQGLQTETGNGFDPPTGPVRNWQVADYALERGDGEGPWVQAEASRRGESVFFRYGIERFYAQQAEAEALEGLLRSNDDQVEVVAAHGIDGRLRIKALIINGERTDLKWW